LLDQGGRVHEVVQHFAKSLKHFVQSREYLEQRRINQLLKTAQQEALSLKEVIKTTNTLDYILQLTGCRLSSLSQWILHDPVLHTIEKGMAQGEWAPIDLDLIGDLIAQSEIDFRTLKANIMYMLQTQAQVSIGEMLNHFPATQGLGSVIGYIALGSRYGVRVGQKETIMWQMEGKPLQRANIPTIYFLKERAHELT